MEKKIIKHLTITGFVRQDELTKLERLEKKLNKAKEKLKIAKKEVKDTKQELNNAVEESLKKIENNKKELIDLKRKDVEDPSPFSGPGFEDIKEKYAQTLANLELKKDEIARKIKEYKSEGTENWDSFKKKLNHDLEELGKTLKSFVTPAK